MDHNRVDKIILLFGLSAGQVSAGQSDIADFVTKLSNAAVAFGLVDGTVQ